jgi:hypothetical protein
MLYRAINQDGGYSARRLTRIDEPPLTQSGHGHTLTPSGARVQITS